MDEHNDSAFSDDEPSPKFKKPVQAERGKDGVWRLTTVDGNTRELRERWHRLVVDLADVTFIRSMAMRVASENWVSEDSYSEAITLRALGHIVGWDTPVVMGQAEDDYSRLKDLEIILRFKRAWGEPPLEKYRAPSEASAAPEYWSQGESQMGSYYGEASHYTDTDGSPIPGLELFVPQDFVQALKEAWERPESILRVRLAVMIRCYSDSYRYYLPPSRSLESVWAYVSDLDVETGRVLPAKSRTEKFLETDPPRNSPLPQTEMVREIKETISNGLRLILGAIVLVAIVLAFGLRR